MAERICKHPSCPLEDALPEVSRGNIERTCSVCGKPGWWLVRTVQPGEYTPVSVVTAYCDECRPRCRE